MKHTRSILINYAGYPASPRMLVPDNGLAILAGALIKSGHQTTILDFATVDTIRKLFPYEYRDRIREVTGRIMAAMKRGDAPAAGDIEQFHLLDGEIEALQRNKVREMVSEIAHMVQERRIDFIGFKLWMGDGFEGSAVIAEELKRRFPRLPIFAGGPNVDWFRERIFDGCGAFDALVYGEGEEAITMLADYVLGRIHLSEIPNLIYREGEKIVTTRKTMTENLDTLPLPVYDETVYPAMGGNQKLKIFLIDESRGCPNRCSFCLHPIKSGNRWRMKSARAVVDDMERIMHLSGTSVFRFAGSNTPHALLREVAKEIVRRKLKVRYVAFANYGIDIATEAYLKIRDSGCFGFWFGVESGNQALLGKVMNKRVSIELLKRTMKACKAAGLFVTASVIVPAPLETEATKQDTLAFLLAVNPDSVIADPPAVVPGTLWDTECNKYNIEILDRERFIREIMFYKIKLIYPPNLFRPFPFIRINGKSDRDLIQETGGFNRLLESHGILTQVTIDSALAANYSGVSPRQFRDQAREYFLSGDHERIHQLISTINENIHTRAIASSASFGI